MLAADYTLNPEKELYILSDFLLRLKHTDYIFFL